MRFQLIGTQERIEKARPNSCFRAAILAAAYPLAVSNYSGNLGGLCGSTRNASLEWGGSFTKKALVDLESWFLYLHTKICVHWYLDYGFK